MAMKSNAYWDNRAKTNMDSYLRDSDETIALLSKAYQRTLRGIESDIENIFENYRRRHALTREQALEYLASPISRSEYEELLSLVDGVTNPLLRQDMLARINAPAYQYRMSREMALQADIDIRMAQLADVEIFEDTRLFHEIIEDAYGHTLFDIQKGTGYGFRVDAMSPGLVQGILRNPWSGELFSERVWKNTGILAEQLNEVLTDALQRGRSWRQTAEELAGRMSVGYHEAERLVRTESVYMANAAEMEGYKAAGIARYRFLATLDSHTCDVCGALDGETFEISAAMPGENMPPMHPNDRCTTVAEFDDMNMADFERMARDPVTGENYKVPANMSYEDWRKTFMPDSPQYSAGDGSAGKHYLSEERKAEIREKAAEVFDRLPSSVRGSLGDVVFVHDDSNNPAVAKMFADEQSGRLRIQLELNENMWYDRSALVDVAHMNTIDTEGMVLMHEAGHAAVDVAALRRAGVTVGQRMDSAIWAAVSREIDIVTRGAYVFAFPESATAEEINDQIRREISDRATTGRELIAESLAKVYFGGDDSSLARKIAQYIIGLLED